MRIITDEQTPQAGRRYRVDNGSEELRPGSFLSTIEVRDESALIFTGPYVVINDWQGLTVVETVQVAP
jgi:hypothetical protein